jgi:hypothetical protein
MSETNWKDTAKRWLHIAGKEVKKTTKLGQKMIQISKLNSEIEEIEKELGKILVKAIKDTTLSWDNQQVGQKISALDDLTNQLQEANIEIEQIKRDDSN